MSNKLINVNALCPFFISESVKSITCEGIIGEQNVTRFNSEQEKKLHQGKYCTKRDYENCEICKVLLEKYIREERKYGDITLKTIFKVP